MVRIFNPFSAAFDVFATRTRPIVPIPTPSSSSSSSNANTKNVNVRVYPLFRGTPPFVARYALVLLSLNIMVTGNLVYECMSGGELYFNPFSKSNNIKSPETREQVTAQSSPSSSSSSSEPSPSSSSSSLTPPISSTSSSSSSSPSPSSPCPPSPPPSHSQPLPQSQIPSQTQNQLSEHQDQDQNQPKPFWRRVSFAAFHLGLGGCIAAFLLSQRARSIRSITIVRSSSSPSPSPSSSFSSSLSHPSSSSSSRSSPPKRTQTRTQTHVYLQTSAHPTGYAHAFRIDECALAPTKMSQDMLVVLTRDAGKFLFAPGARGSWVVGVDVGKSKSGRDGEVEEKKVEGEAETLEETKTQENEKPITINKAEAEKQKRKLAKSNVLKLWKELGGKVERLSQ